MTLRTQSLHLAYGDRDIIQDLGIEIPEGKITALLGPNGSGKSTVLKGLSRLLLPRKGVVLLEGKELKTFPPKDLAKRMAVLPQSSETPEGVCVEELVSYGRSPYLNWFGRPGKKDREAVKRAMDLAQVSHLAEFPVSDLSGGQRQRVWIAMALAQETDYLLLDEPTTYLDLEHQQDLLELLRELNSAEKRTVVMVLHDLNQAAAYAHHLLVLKEGRPVAEGSPREVLTPELLKEVFRVDGVVMDDPRKGHPFCLVYPLRSDPKS